MSSPSLTGSTAVASPALSVASWSAIDDVYQVNIIAAQQVIEDFLNSPHNTWNYPSPNTSPDVHPRRSPTPSIPFSPVVGTHYCLAVGNDEGLELDETGEDEKLREVDEEEAEEYEGEDVGRIQSGGGRQENSLRDYSLNSRGLIYKYRVVCA